MEKGRKNFYNETVNTLFNGRIQKMKLGAQLFSLRTFIQTPEDLKSTFLRVKEIGYENVQLSGNAPMSADDILAAVDASGLPIVCTHSPLDRIIGDTDALIADHKRFGCSVIGLGAMPKEARGSLSAAEEFFATLEAPVAKILDAGLNFAYHNHAFEFDKLEDSDAILYDYMLEKFPDWHFIGDTYWFAKAGRSPVEYIEKIGSKRLVNIHYKDMANNEDRSICACGKGTLDFSEITSVCERLGVKNVLVEQDNAVKTDDPFGEMAFSYNHLKDIVK